MEFETNDRIKQTQSKGAKNDATHNAERLNLLILLDSADYSTAEFTRSAIYVGIQNWRSFEGGLGYDQAR